MNGALKHDVKLFNGLAVSSYGEQLAAIRRELVDNDTGIGLDGRAAELVAAILAADGELYTDGECLDLIGLAIDVWRSVNGIG